MKMYDELATWWPLLSAPDEYVEEAAFYLRSLRSACDGEMLTLLELGSGGGNNASHMKHGVEVTLVDPSAGMLAVSETLNPECTHVQGDMRSVRLGREFDAVFIQDAICYMTSEAELLQALETAFVHCRPGGAALFAPDFTKENFRSTTDCGGCDAGAQGLRYLEWVWDPEPGDSTYLVDYALVLREADGSVRIEHDRHLEGLFARGDWLKLLREVGFEAESLPFHHSDHPDVPLEVFVGRRG